MKVSKNSIKRKIKTSLPAQIGVPDFKKEKTALGTWGRDQIKNLELLGQEIVTMRMEARR